MREVNAVRGGNRTALGFQLLVLYGERRYGYCYSKEFKEKYVTVGK